MTTLDYATVSRYWNRAASSILGPYMMDGFGFPAGAGLFRFRAECKIVNRLVNGRLVHGLNLDGCVLDLGSGIGFWAEYFAQRFSQVVAVEASRPLHEVLEEHCVPYPNVKTIHDDVMYFKPEDQYDVVFLGGILMYLNEEDVVDLLEKLIPSLQPGGIVLCRETTVRQGTTMRQGDYQAVYRSVADYEQIFTKCGLSVLELTMNTPYILMQMGCELIKKWKKLMPTYLQCLPIVGRLVYWSLRLGHPWIARVPMALGLAYPKLTNHFFVLQPVAQPTSTIAARITVA